MNPPKFKHDQTVYLVFDSENPEYKSFLVGRIELGKDQNWVYYPPSNNPYYRSSPYWEHELSADSPTIEQRVEAALYENFVCSDNDDWEQGFLPRNVLEHLAKKAGYWKDEYGA